MTMEQRIGDADHANTLASIAECLRAADEQHIIIGIAGNGGLIRRLERLREILAEVHSEVSKVFHHDDIVLRSQLANGLKFLLTQTNP